MDYADLYQFLTEAEDRAANHADAAVRERSTETVALCEQRMANENIDRDTLEVLAKVDRRIAEYDIDTLVTAAVAWLEGMSDDNAREAVRHLARERDALRRELARARDWIASTPHGDNCFVSNAYEGDPGNQCNCGKDSFDAASCPKCGSNDVAAHHHAGDFAAPECDYQQCMTCWHQWGHQ